MAVPRVSVKVEYSKKENNIQTVNFGNTYASLSGYKGQNYKNSTLETISIGANPFILGKSKLGSGAKYSSEYDGYISNVASTSSYYGDDQQKGYIIPNGGIKITIGGTSPIKQLFLFFDKVVGEYPVVIKVVCDGIENEFLNDNKELFVWSNESSTSNTLNVYLLSWSKPNSLVRLTGLLDGLQKTYDRSNGLVGVSVKIQSTTSDMPEYGCIGKTDSIRLYDRNYEIKSFAERGFLKEDIPVSVYIGNNLISKYKTSSDWSESNNEISVSIEDEIMGWGNLYPDLKEPPYKYISLNTFSPSQVVENLWELLVAVLKKTGVDVDGGSYLGRLFWTNGAKTHLEKIKLGIWYQPNKLSLTEIVNNICTLGQVNIYIGINDKIVVSKI